MNSVINHVANVAIAAQPKVSGEKTSHATAQTAKTARRWIRASLVWKNSAAASPGAADSAKPQSCEIV
jgi:hypothetical protein